MGRGGKGAAHGNRIQLELLEPEQQLSRNRKGRSGNFSVEESWDTTSAAINKTAAGKRGATAGDIVKESVTAPASATRATATITATTTKRKISRSRGGTTRNTINGRSGESAGRIR